MTVIGALPTATTKVAAVIGSPIRHSLSPALLNTAFSVNGDDWVYGAFEVEATGLRAVVDATRALPLGGLNVTMPLKATIIDHLDAIDPTAERLGSVNCVAWHDDRLIGHSTDGAGLVDALDTVAGFDPSGHRCAVVGAGGAARAAIAALADAGAAEVLVVNRTAARAETAAALAGDAGRVGRASELGDADLIVNATPAGMSGVDAPIVPFDVELVHAGQVVYDMVYQPRRTPLVEQADAAGARAVGGVSMLVHQAARAYRLWTGRDAPIDAMTAAVGAVA